MNQHTGESVRFLDRAPAPKAPFEILRPPPGLEVPLIIHIPHSGLWIPPEVRATLPADLWPELLALTDHKVDLLYAQAPSLGATVMVNRFSRLVVDPERFPSDADEPMAKHGQGVVYMKTTDGAPLRGADFTTDDHEELLRRYYWPYAEAMEALVDGMLDRFGQCWIIDAHSYPQTPLPWEPAGADRPDYCLGWSEPHRPTGWLHEPGNPSPVEGALHEPDSPGARLHNTLYKGAYVPLKRYDSKDARVKSLLLEIRRDLYMDERTGRYNGPGHLRVERFAAEAVAWIAHRLGLDCRTSAESSKGGPPPENKKDPRRSP